MNYRNLIIVLLLLLCLYLFFSKAPKIENVKYITKTKYEQKVDTILVETVKIRSKIIPYFDTIVSIKEKLVYFRYNSDTVNLVKWQDSLIKNQDSVILWQDDLIESLDTVVVNQAKAIDFYKDSIVDLNLDLVTCEKKKKRRGFVSAALSLLSVGLILNK